MILLTASEMVFIQRLVFIEDMFTEQEGINRCDFFSVSCLLDVYFGYCGF